MDIYAFCLMDNHVHFLVKPHKESSLGDLFRTAHMKYSHYYNRKKGQKGHLWQGRFASFTMDEGYLLAASQYVELNPVRAKLVTKPEAYKWSSSIAHHEGRDDELVKVLPLLNLVGNWREFLSQAAPHQMEELRRHERTGRPLGGIEFVAKLEKISERILRPQKPGPKQKTN